MQQELVREREAVTERSQRQERVDFEAQFTDTERVAVELTRRTETLTAEEVREDGDTRTVIDLDEEEQTTTFEIPSPQEVYRHILPSPWERLAGILLTNETPLPDDWTVPTPDLPADEERGTAHEDPILTIMRPFRSPALQQERRTVTETARHRAAERIEEYRPELVQNRIDAPLPPDDGYAPGLAVVRPPHEEELLQRSPPEDAPRTLEMYAREQDGLVAMLREDDVLQAFYGPEENENGTTHRLLYRVEEEATVKDTLLDLVDRGIIDATITRQPFYSPEPFVKDGELVEGWTEAYAVVAMEGMPIQMTEFSYGRGDLDLAEDDIASVEVGPGDVVDFAAAHIYTCGTDTETVTAARSAWEEHDTYGWFEDDWERSVYAALAEGHAFEGSPLDLSHAPRVRDAYMDAFGVAPEDVFDNVTYGR